MINFIRSGKWIYLNLAWCLFFVFYDLYLAFSGASVGFASLNAALMIGMCMYWVIQLRKWKKTHD